MNTKISGRSAARTSRPAHLTVAPEPDAELAPAEDTERSEAEQVGFLAGLLAAREAYLASLAEHLDARYRALAGIDRIEELDLDELDELIEFATAVAHSKRTARPTLELVSPTNPRFVVQHTTAGRHQVVPVDPESNGRPVKDGADIVSFADAAALRDRLNAAGGAA